MGVSHHGYWVRSSLKIDAYWDEFVQTNASQSRIHVMNSCVPVRLGELLFLWV